jgi:hypothetical protein
VWGGCIRDRHAGKNAGLPEAAAIWAISLSSTGFFILRRPTYNRFFQDRGGIIVKLTKPALVLSTVLSLLFLWITASFAAPNAMNFQGRLTDTVGNNVPDGTYFMQFLIYDVETSGSALWGESQDVSVTGGIYNVTLGQGTSLGGSFDSALFNGDDRWLEVWFDGETLLPRQKLTSVAYALQAQEAVSVISSGIATDMLQDQAVDQVKLADNAVNSAKIIDGSISSVDISDGPGSGLDADTLDGLSPSAFAPSSHAHSSLNAADGSPTNSVYVDNSGNVGVGTTSPESGVKLHVNGLALFELGSGRLALTTPGARPGFIGWHNDGTRSDIVFHNDGVFIAKNELNAIPEEDNGLMVHENGRVGIGTLNPNARLEVRGEVRTTDQYGGTRLWGHGRPGCTRLGTTGVEVGLCSNGQVEFGLGTVYVDWGEAANGCPAGTWVCTAAERGNAPCDTTITGNGSNMITAIDCGGDRLYHDDFYIRGWVADRGLIGFDGYSIKENGDRQDALVCNHFNVWCCSSIYD